MLSVAGESVGAGKQARLAASSDGGRGENCMIGHLSLIVDCWIVGLLILICAGFR
jgi:hypothetical protein